MNIIFSQRHGNKASLVQCMSNIYTFLMLQVTNLSVDDNATSTLFFIYAHIVELV